MLSKSELCRGIRALLQEGWPMEARSGQAPDAIDSMDENSLSAQAEVGAIRPTVSALTSLRGGGIYVLAGRKKKPGPAAA